jgi:hypothetical protein
MLFVGAVSTAQIIERRMEWQKIITNGGKRGSIQKFPDESITKYTLRKINTRCEVTQMVMAVKLTRPTHKMWIQLHLVAESCTICSSCSRRPIRKLLDTPSCIGVWKEEIVSQFEGTITE